MIKKEDKNSGGDILLRQKINQGTANGALYSRHENQLNMPKHMGQKYRKLCVSCILVSKRPKGAVLQQNLMQNDNART